MENMEDSEKIGEIRKKSKLNSEKIGKIWKKSKLNSEKIRKIWKISVLVIITPKETSSSFSLPLAHQRETPKGSRVPTFCTTTIVRKNRGNNPCMCTRSLP